MSYSLPNLKFFDQFEKTPGGNIPYRLLATHPDGKYVAMQASGPESFVWDKETGKLVWSTPYAIAMAWLQNGTQIAVLRGVEAGPHNFALFDWPTTQFLRSCRVSQTIDGDMIDLVISPNSDLALCHWIDQTEAGFEFIDITSQRVVHDPKASFFFEGTNEFTRAVFTKDGRYWVCGYQMEEIWWAVNPEDPDPDQPATGGQYPLGELLIFQGKKQISQVIPLIATLPAGWLPPDPDAVDELHIGDPLFVDDDSVQIRLPSGEINVYPLSLE